MAIERLEFLETRVNKHVAESNSRLEKHETMLNHNALRMDEIEVHQSSTDKIMEELRAAAQVRDKMLDELSLLVKVANDTFDIIRPLGKALAAVGKAVKWFGLVGAGFVAIWHAAKLIYAKIMVLLA